MSRTSNAKDTPRLLSFLKEDPLPEQVLTNVPRGHSNTSKSLYSSYNDNDFSVINQVLYRKNILSNNEEVKIIIPRYSLKPGSFTKNSPLGIIESYNNKEKEDIIYPSSLNGNKESISIHSLWKNIDNIYKIYYYGIENNVLSSFTKKIILNSSDLYNTYKNEYSTFNRSRNRYWIPLEYISLRNIDREIRIDKIKDKTPFWKGVSSDTDNFSSGIQIVAKGYVKKPLTKFKRTSPNYVEFSQNDYKNFKKFISFDNLGIIINSKPIIPKKKSFGDINPDFIDDHLLKSNNIYDSIILVPVLNKENIYPTFPNNPVLGKEDIYPTFPNNPVLGKEDIYPKFEPNSVLGKEDIYPVFPNNPVLGKEDIYPKFESNQILKNQNIYPKVNLNKILNKEDVYPTFPNNPLLGKEDIYPVFPNNPILNKENLYKNDFIKEVLDEKNIYPTFPNNEILIKEKIVQNIEKQKYLNKENIYNISKKSHNLGKENVYK